MQRKPSVRKLGCALLAAMFVLSRSADAACLRPIVAAYSTPTVAERLGAWPDLRAPSVPDEVASLSHCTIEVRDLPTARVFAAFANGKLDLVFGATRTDERDRLADFVPSKTLPLLLITRQASANLPQRIEEFSARHLRVGVLRGGRFSDEIQPLIDELRRRGLADEATDRDEAYRKLEAGRDAALLDVISPEDRPEYGSLRVLVQNQFRPIAFGAYLRHEHWAEPERQALLDAIEQSLAKRHRLIEQSSLMLGGY